ncbi:MAG TPA: monofunctional biosynthetic peptidoglycan transglycosylase [Longimicrobiaceae bacterium]|nr:monofunctional biosynthetic peptidoglycan transglycosylase [Longimicrobiaceae bacterium]
MKRFLRIALYIVLGFYGLCLLSFVYLRFLPPLFTVVQLQREVESWFSDAEHDRRYDFVSLASISDHLEHAVVAAEDTRFYEHSGFDWEQIQKARAEAEREGTAPRGASTITQQLVKNLFFTTHRSYIRKGLEITLTPMAEVILGKDRILELYLNVIEWGIGVYGAEAAAEYYYGVPASELSRGRAARLAGIIPAPRERTPDGIGWYSDIILGRMGQMGW